MNWFIDYPVHYVDEETGIWCRKWPVKDFTKDPNEVTCKSCLELLAVANERH